MHIDEHFGWACASQSSGITHGYMQIHVALHAKATRHLRTQSNCIQKAHHARFLKPAIVQYCHPHFLCKEMLVYKPGGKPHPSTPIGSDSVVHLQKLAVLMKDESEIHPQSQVMNNMGSVCPSLEVLPE
uniref:Uncharacterized protein n=1 Tax=Micrurus spixii TaxID=129469 RepID=A0A2D4MJB2_9SAUR